ncbi:DUF58 domain-containing protein [Candidatus Solirubrobacter pratensis]|uniref:DUF58 domain-containing protein n=1 Tax=Candidatus Solirubrobacter pratensis TaxID=1298857 RepID=UPI0004285112|nr:DUF58 domain-containing protein [Candidatus Solirubrobacter pratensis]
MTRPLALLAAAAFLAAVAGTLPSPALTPASVALAFVALAAWAVTDLSARRIRVTRTVLETEVREDEPLAVEFGVRGLGRLPVTIEALDGNGAWRPLETTQGPRRESGTAAAAGSLALTVPRRGRYLLAPSQLRIRDRLGIAERRLTAGAAHRFLVLPAPDEAAARASATAAAAGDPEPDGLYAYVPGVPVSRIHWPALARGAGLYARRLATAAHDLPLVVVDTAGDPTPGALDWVARAAAGHVQELARAGGCRVVLPGDEGETTVGDAASWRAVHRRLALLGAGPPTLAPPGAILISAAGVRPSPRPPLPKGVEAA